MLGLFYCFYTSLIFILEIRYFIYSVYKKQILLRFQIILFPKTNLRRKQMAKSDLLKEAIADAKAVKETALANAKIALQEAFHPRMQSMMSAKISEELDEQDDEMDLDAELAGEEMPVDDMAPAGDDMAMDDMGDEGEAMDVGDLELDTDMDGEIDFTGDIMSKPGMEAEPEMEPGMDDMGDVPVDDMEGDAGMGDDMGDDLGIEEIIRELEEDLEAEGMRGNPINAEEDEPVMENYSEEDTGIDKGEVLENKSIDELIEAILAEEEDEEEKEDDKKEEKEEKEEISEVKADLEEAYRTVKHLQSVINEVNLLNAKLLYTNKLFRNFELNESQKMKVIENFDRASSTREAKLVFATLAESFHTPRAGKKIVKESRSMASKPVATTAPSKKTTQVLSEGFEQANRWKKLAGLIK